MPTKAKVGHIIWHDLLTQNVAQAKHFYAGLLNWNYQIEHASDFVWKPGEAEYPLIFVNGEAHGGFVDFEPAHRSGWTAYVMVQNTDAVTAKAKSLGLRILREPFDTPGVGRSSLIQDPQGALFCPTCPTHTFPAPSGTFLWDELITDDVESTTLLYCDLFGWRFQKNDMTQTGGDAVLKRTDSTNHIQITNQFFGAVGFAAWIPYLATSDIDTTIVTAKQLGASVCKEDIFSPGSGTKKAILKDPVGAMFGLLAPSP